MVLNMVVQHSALLGQFALNVEDFYVINRVGLTWKSGLFPCYRLKINDFLSSHNQNLKINIFTPLQQMPCYCKNRLGTLGLITWWRVTIVVDRNDTVLPDFVLTSYTVLFFSVSAVHCWQGALAHYWLSCMAGQCLFMQLVRYHIFCLIHTSSCSFSTM